LPKWPYLAEPTGCVFSRCCQLSELCDIQRAEAAGAAARSRGRAEEAATALRAATGRAFEASMAAAGRGGQRGAKRRSAVQHDACTTAASELMDNCISQRMHPCTFHPPMAKSSCMLPLQLDRRAKKVSLEDVAELGLPACNNWVSQSGLYIIFNKYTWIFDDECF
jgi:hypothetical protein